MERTSPRRCSLLFAALLLVLCAFSADAQQIIRVPGDAATIQAAINAASPGDTVLVGPGTYYENLDFLGKAITVTSSAGAAQTIIDGARKAPVVTFQSQETRASILSEFTLQNGNSTLDDNENPVTSGGIYVGPQAAPSILNNIITSNGCSGVYSNSGNPLIQGNEITHTFFNTAYICFMPGGPAVSINGEDANPPAGIGPVVIGNTIEENNAPEALSTTGIYIFGDASVLIENNIIRNNLTGGSGGALSMNDTKARTDQPPKYTGGELFFIQNLIEGNKAVGGYGGLKLFFNPAGAGPSNSLLANNTIANNTGYKSASSATQPPSQQVDLEQTLSTVSLVNNIVIGSGAEPALTCTSTKGFDNPTPPVLDHNDIFNSSGVALAGSCAGLDDLSFNPRFTNAATGDFTLLPISPAIDAGNNSVLYLQPKDLAGNPRPVDATGRAYPIVDLGAYEASGVADGDPTTILLSLSSNSVDAGTSITLNATLASLNGIPYGPVTFLEDGVEIGSSSISSSGIASFATQPLVPGVHSMIATYAGQSGFTPGISVLVYVLVGKYQPTITLTSDINPSTFGQTVTFRVSAVAQDKAVLSPIVIDDVTDTPTTIAVLSPDANGNASSAISTLSVGTHKLAALYQGDSAHLPAEGDYTEVVNPGLTSTLAFTCTPNPTATDIPINLNAVVTGSSGTPAGTITVTLNSAVYATLMLNASGAASGTFAPLPIGQDTLVATYSTTNGYAQSTSSCSVNVSLAGSVTHLSATPSPATFGKAVILTAHVTASDGSTNLTGGSVAFTSSLGGPLGSVSVSQAGIAETTLSNLPAGTQQITATYSGISDHGPSTGTVTLDVSLGADSLSLTASTQQTSSYQPITLKAQFYTDPVRTTSGQLIQFTANGASIGTAATDTSGVAAITVSSLTTGTYTLGASFAGDNSYGPASAPPLSEVIVPAATTLSLTANPATAYQSQAVILTATASSSGISVVPAGTIAIIDTSTAQTLTSQPVGTNGTVSFSTSLLAIGTHNLSASFTPSSQIFNPSATAETTTVTIRPEDFTITANIPSLTIRTEYHATLDLTTTSLGQLADNIALSCANLPEFATCTFTPTSIALTPGSVVNSTVTLNTDQLEDYRSSATKPVLHDRSPSGLAYAAMLPVMLLISLRRRARHIPRLTIVLLALALIPLSGCSGKLPGHTPPGTYNISIQAYSPTLKQTRTVQITLDIVP